MPQCRSCGAAYSSGQLICEFCDSDLSNASSSAPGSPVEPNSSEIELLKIISKLSRKLRKKRFTSKDLDSLFDLDDEISLEEANPLNLRFKELLNSISDNYLKVNSIVLFGEIHKIFESRID